MILCIAEKPSVAKDIAEILGARTERMAIGRETAIGLAGPLGTFVP